MDIEDHLQKLITSHYDNPHEYETCACGWGKRVVQCRYDGCFQYPTSCQLCFISQHQQNPFHWALVWDTSKCIWIQHDLSELSDECAIQLGHIYNQIPCSGTRSSVPFTVTHTNGVHSTQLRFCGCPDAQDRVSQLMLANLFPTTPNNPKSAYTFAVLKHFHMHNLQSKCGTFDFVLSLRHLTDNVFTVKVPIRSQFYHFDISNEL
jgi:hypothetical protein